jgi:hypothetical protein
MPYPGASHHFARGMILYDGERRRRVLAVNHAENSVTLGEPRWFTLLWWRIQAEWAAVKRWWYAYCHRP